MNEIKTAVNCKASGCYKPNLRRRETNLLIRNTLAEHGLYQWQLAEMLGIREESLSRQMRHELPIAEQERIVKLIESEMKGETNE